MKAILLNRILLVLAFVGLFVAGVLSLEARGAIAPCGPGGGCLTVAQHPTSKWFGIPVAFFGAGGYLALVLMAAARTFMTPQKSGHLVTIGYAISAFGAVTSLVLQYISFFIIRASCLWCISSAVIMVLQFILHTVLVQELDKNPDLPEDFTPTSRGRLDEVLVAGLPLAVIIGLVVMNSTMGRVPPPAINITQDELKKVVFVPEELPHIYGDSEAPVTIVEFADVLCNACQHWSPEVKKYVTEHPGKVRLVYRHYPLQQIHPMAMVTAAVSEYAAEKGRFWDFVMAQMEKGGTPAAPSEILETATQIGLNADEIRARLGDDQDKVYDRIARDMATVKQLGINSTPTFFILVGNEVKATVGGPDLLGKLESPEIQAAMNKKPAPAAP